ncbi:MAG: hypothetical protein AB7I96_09220 [Candidatus Dadabacteria bacterium]
MSDQGTNFASTSSTDGGVSQGLEAWIGEGKKYKTPDEALQSVPHAQEHIRKLEQTLNEMRDELASRSKLDDLIQRLDTQNSMGNGGEPSTSAQPVESFDPLKVQSLLDEMLTKRELEAKTKANLGQVVTSLKAQFGDQAEAAYVAKARELGLSKQEFDQIAARSPQMVLAHFPKQESRGNVATRSDVNPAALPSIGGNAKPGTHAWYKELRKADPKSYFSKEVQVRMHEDAQRLGADFYK